MLPYLSSFLDSGESRMDFEQTKTSFKGFATTGPSGIGTVCGEALFFRNRVIQGNNLLTWRSF